MSMLTTSVNMQDIVTALLRGVDYLYGSSIEGDLAEFGTFAGNTARAISYQMVHCRNHSASKNSGKPTPDVDRKKFHLFDSFVGLPAATAQTDLSHPDVQKGTWAPGTCHGVTAAQLEAELIKMGLSKENYVIHDGWYNATVPKLPDDTRFGLIHVDCDLYQSTMDALDPLFARGMVSKGAIILFDDWNCGGADDSLGERAAWRDLVERHAISFEPIGFYASMGYRLFVKGYGK